MRGLKERARLQTAFARIFEHVDALALPTVAITAPVLQQRSVNGPGSAGVRETLLGLTNPWNVLGLPAISLPAGFVDGLPVGLQLVGPAGADAALWRWRRGIGSRRALESGRTCLRQAAQSRAASRRAAC